MIDPRTVAAGLVLVITLIALVVFVTGVLTQSFVMTIGGFIIAFSGAIATAGIILVTINRD